MPTYDYVCGSCGRELEIFQSMTEAPKRKCPACGKLKLKRQLGTGGGIIFKGTGFYQTDYRSDGYKSAAKAESPPAPAMDGASKPAAAQGAKKDGGSKSKGAKSDG